MSDIHAAMAELDKMTRVLKAFEGVRIVFTALANAEQVEKELADSIATKRGFLAKLTGDADATAALIDEAKASAKDIVAQAKAEGADFLAGAKAEAEAAVATARVEAQVFFDEKAVEAEKLVSLAQEVKTELEGDIGKLKEKLSSLAAAQERFAQLLS
jgi:hypothetical protein